MGNLQGDREATQALVKRIEHQDSMIRTLTNHVGELNERITQLKNALAPRGLQFPPSLELTPSETIILSAIYARSPASCSKESLLVALYGGDHHASLGILGVFVSKLRKKLAPFVIVVFSDWGHGYSLDKENKARLTALMRGDLARIGSGDANNQTKAGQADPIAGQ